MGKRLPSWFSMDVSSFILMSQRFMTHNSYRISQFSPKMILFLSWCENPCPFILQWPLRWVIRIRHENKRDVTWKKKKVTSVCLFSEIESRPKRKFSRQNEFGPHHHPSNVDYVFLSLLRSSIMSLIFYVWRKWRENCEISFKKFLALHHDDCDVISSLFSIWSNTHLLLLRSFC